MVTHDGQHEDEGCDAHCSPHQLQRRVTVWHLPAGLMRAVDRSEIEAVDEDEPEPVQCGCEWQQDRVGVGREPAYRHMRAKDERGEPGPVDEGPERQLVVVAE